MRIGDTWWKPSDKTLHAAKRQSSKMSNNRPLNKERDDELLTQGDVQIPEVPNLDSNRSRPENHDLEKLFDSVLQRRE